MVRVRVKSVKNAPSQVRNRRAKAKAIVASGVLSTFKGELAGPIMSDLAEIQSVTKIDSGIVLDEYEYIVNVREERAINMRRALGSSIEDKREKAKILASSFATKLDLSDETIERSEEIVDAAYDESYASGNQPTSIAAASVNVASLLNNEERTRSQIADIADVTENTISKHVNSIFELELL